MIYIFEDTKRKLSGLTSLYIKSQFDVNIVNIIKSCETYFFHKDNHTWEVPVNSLAYLLDNLVYIDDIDLFVEDKEDNTPKRQRILEYKTKPYPYQLKGIEWGLNNDKGLLLDEPGLGKTLQMIYLAEELKAQEGIEHCLIICGIASLRANWEKEIKKHSNLDCTILGSRINKNGKQVIDGITKRVEQLNQPIKEFFIILNIESLRDNRILEAIQKGPNKFDMMVFDECHKAKGYASIQGKNLLEVLAKHQIAMTGTLLLNKPIDAYIPLAWIGVEPKRGVTKFKNTYCVLDERVKGRILGYKNLDLLKEEIDSCSLRRTKELLDLPPKNFIDEVLTMEDSQNSFYNTIKKSVLEEYRELAKEMVDKVKLSTSNLLALTTRLRQATTCPNVLTSQSIPNCKIDRACDLVEEIVSNGNKVVIMSTFKEPIYILNDLLKEYNPLVGTGDMNDIEVSQNVDKFQKDDKYKVFLGTIQKIGTGLTLTSASYMIFIDLPWTDGLYQQGCDRIHRISQDKPVFIYNLICKGTIDEVTREAIDTKRAISDYVLDGEIDDSMYDKLQKYIKDLEE